MIIASHGELRGSGELLQLQGLLRGSPEKIQDGLSFLFDAFELTLRVSEPAHRSYLDCCALVCGTDAPVRQQVVKSKCKSLRKHAQSYKVARGRPGRPEPWRAHRDFKPRPRLAGLDRRGGNRRAIVMQSETKCGHVNVAKDGPPADRVPPREANFGRELFNANSDPSISGDLVVNACLF